VYDCHSSAAFDGVCGGIPEVAERAEDIFGVVSQGDLETGGPASQAQAVLRVALEIDNLTQVRVVLNLESLLVCGVDLKWAAHRNLPRLTN
jgi:hypothetical protein